MVNTSITGVTLLCILFLYLLLPGCAPSKKLPGYSGELFVNVKAEEVSPAREIIRDVPRYDSIQIKYAGYLNVSPGTIKNASLYYFIDKWLNTPYRWGGTNESGIDCSAFLQRLLAEVYVIHIPRTSVEQFLAQRVERFTSADHLSEGDLVFFRTMKNKIISHVGLYHS